MPDGELPEGLTFDEASHTYRYRGVVVPNVTRVLGSLIDLSHVDPEKLEHARQEGVAMHRMSDLHFKGELHIPSLPDWLVPRLAALKRFVSETGFRVVASEQKLYHPTYAYAGTFDLVGHIPVKNGRLYRDVTACVDLKRSFFAGRVTGLQTAGYALLWEDQGHPRIQRRLALKLHANGTYATDLFEDPADRSVFLAALALYKWRNA